MAQWKNRRPVIAAASAATPAAAEDQPRRGFLKRLLTLTAGGAVVAAANPPAASAGIDQWIGEIALVGFNFEPQGWAFCNGQLLAISQNTALFSLLGTTYGGNGTTNFALPDLRGRVPLHFGQGPGLSLYNLGQAGGVEAIALTMNQMPAHNHLVNASAANGTSDTPTNAIPGKNASGVPDYSSAAPNTQMAPGAIAPAGANQPHENRPPYLALNFVIALQGIFPSRN
jgi:microcystin-dependent protein